MTEQLLKHRLGGITVSNYTTVVKIETGLTTFKSHECLTWGKSHRLGIRRVVIHLFTKNIDRFFKMKRVFPNLYDVIPEAV